jgi:hypothetical protein
MKRTKGLNYLIGTIFALSLFLGISYPLRALETSQKLLYQGSYFLEQEKIDHTLTFQLDYLEEISNDLFLEGDLVVRITNNEYSKPIITGPNELYLNAYNILENLDLKAGKIITSWGAADLFSPLDNFNSMFPDLLSLINNQGRKLGTLGINATYYINNLTYLQTVLLPQLNAIPYPDQYLKEIYLAQYGLIYQTQGINIDSLEISYQQPKDIIWGLRFNHTFPSFDAGISYYHGYYLDPFPLSLDMSLHPSGNTLTVALGYPAKQVLGLEFQGDFPGIAGATLRGDLAYIIPETWQCEGEKILEKPYLQAAISADYTTDADLYLNSGFFYGLPLEKGDDCSPYLYLYANQEISNSDFSPFYIGILSLKDMSMGNIIGLDYQISENVVTSFSYVFLLGDNNSKLGVLKSAAGFYFSLEWSF